MGNLGFEPNFPTKLENQKSYLKKHIDWEHILEKKKKSCHTPLRTLKYSSSKTLNNNFKHLTISWLPARLSCTEYLLINKWNSSANLCWWYYANNNMRLDSSSVKHSFPCQMYTGLWHSQNNTSDKLSTLIEDMQLTVNLFNFIKRK